MIKEAYPNPEVDMSSYTAGGFIFEAVYSHDGPIYGVPHSFVESNINPVEVEKLEELKLEISERLVSNDQLLQSTLFNMNSSYDTGYFRAKREDGHKLFMETWYVSSFEKVQRGGVARYENMIKLMGGLSVLAEKNGRISLIEHANSLAFPIANINSDGVIVPAGSFTQDDVVEVNDATSQLFHAKEAGLLPNLFAGGRGISGDVTFWTNEDDPKLKTANCVKYIFARDKDIG